MTNNNNNNSSSNRVINRMMIIISLWKRNKLTIKRTLTTIRKRNQPYQQQKIQR